MPFHWSNALRTPPRLVCQAWKTDKQTKPFPTHRLQNKPFIKTFNQTTSWHLWNRPIRSVRSTAQNWLCGFPVITQVCQLLWRQLRWETSDGFIFFTRSGKGFSNLIFNIPSIAHFPDRQAKSQKRLKLSNCEIFKRGRYIYAPPVTANTCHGNATCYLLKNNK